MGYPLGGTSGILVPIEIISHSTIGTYARYLHYGEWVTIETVPTKVPTVGSYNLCSKLSMIPRNVDAYAPSRHLWRRWQRNEVEQSISCNRIVPLKSSILRLI